LLAIAARRMIGLPMRGYWYWDAVSGELLWDSTMQIIYGMPPDPKGYVIGTYEDLFESRLWDVNTTQYVRYAVEMSKAHHEPFRHDFRIRRGDGSLAIVRGTGHWLYKDGNPVAMCGFNTAYRLTPDDTKLVGSLMVFEELNHAAKSPTMSTPSSGQVAGALVMLHSCLQHVR